MNGRWSSVLLGVLLLTTLVSFSVAGAASVHPSGARSAATSPVTGNLTGPTLLATGATGRYEVNGTGGPAFLPNGTKVGNLTFYASVSATNLTGVSISPASAALVGAPFRTNLVVGATAEVVTIRVLIASVYQHQNQSINLSYAVVVVVPYVVTATIVDSSSATVLSFPVQVTLDGAPVGVVTVPTLTAGQTFNLSYTYTTVGLSPGEHTFSISLATEHGLVVFASGATVYSTSFYVQGPAPSYTLWYLAGAVAFFGVLFIFVTRVAARRRSALRK
jgi:predicted DNA-binding ribbon-helix-helix protein